MRGTGTTTFQMMKAPKDAVYVWVNNHLEYPKSLARHLGRDDLVIVPPRYFDRCENLRGIRRIKGSIVVDHAAELTRKQCENFNELLGRLE